MKNYIVLTMILITAAIESKRGGIAKSPEKYPPVNVYIDELPLVAIGDQKDLRLPIFTTTSLIIETPLGSGRWRQTRDEKMIMQERAAYKSYEEITLLVTCFGLESQKIITIPGAKRHDRRTGIGSSLAGFELDFSDLTEPVLCTVRLENTIYRANKASHFIVKPLPWNWKTLSRK